MKEELLKIEGAYSYGEYVEIPLDYKILVIDTDDGYVAIKNNGISICLFSNGTKEEVLTLVKALVR